MKVRGRASASPADGEGAAAELTHTKSSDALSLSSLSNAALSRAKSKSSGKGNGKQDGFEESGLSAAQRAIKALPLEDEQASTGGSSSSSAGSSSGPGTKDPAEDDRSPRTREKERLDKKSSWTPFKGFRKANSAKKVDPKDPSTWGAKKL